MIGTNRVKVSNILSKIVLACALSCIGLAVGFSVVLLPMGVPIGIVAIATGLLLWVLPDIPWVPERFARRMFYVFTFSVLCIPQYFAIILPSLPWMSFRRLIFIAFVVPFTVIIAASSKHRSQLVATLKTPSVPYACFIGFLVMIVLSTILSADLATSFNSVVNMSTIWFIPFIAAILLIRNSDDIDRISKLFVVCVITDFGFGLVESRLGRPFLPYLLPPAMRSQMLASNPLYATLFNGQGVRNGLYRAASTFNISLSWGEMASMLAPMSLHFLVHGRRPTEHALGAVGFVASFGSIVLSGSRGAYVGFIAATIAYTLLWAIRYCRTNPQSLAGPNALFIFSMASALVVGAVLFVGPVRGYVLGSGNTQSSTDARWAEWALAKPKVLQNPIWGYGPGTSAEVVAYHPFGSLSATVDSYIITALVEFGVVGALLFLGLVVSVIAIAIHDYLKNKDSSSAIGNALACCLIAFLVYRITLSQQENMTSMFILCGIIVVFHRSMYRSNENFLREIRVGRHKNPTSEKTSIQAA